MNLDDMFKKKLGPVPVWIIAVAVVAVGWFLYKQYRAKGANGEQNAGETGNPWSPASGSLEGTNTAIGGDGTSATQTSNGPLLSGAFVGVPGGQSPVNYDPNGGNIYLNFPGSPAQTTSQSSSAQTYTVKAGDTLSRIARRIWGDSSLWRQIYQTNLNIVGNDPNNIEVGQVLTVPPLSQGDIHSANQSSNSASQHNRDDNKKHSSGRR